MNGGAATCGGCFALIVVVFGIIGYGVYSVASIGRDVNQRTVRAAAPSSFASPRTWVPPTTSTTHAPPPAPRTANVPRNKPGYLSDGGNTELPVCRTPEAFILACRAALRNDTDQINALVANGQVFGVPQGTRVLTVSWEDPDPGAYAVTIMSGPHAGEEGWVLANWIHR